MSGNKEIVSQRQAYYEQKQKEKKIKKKTN